MDDDVEYTSFGIPGCEPVHKKKGFMHNLVARFVDRNTSTKVTSRLENITQCTSLVNDQQPDVSCQETHTDTDACSRALSTEKMEKFASSSIPFSGSNLSSHGTYSSVKRLHLPFQSSATGSGDAVTNLAINRRYWMTDESCRQCFECACRFTPIRRKHHCRVCGRIFCHQCSNKFIEGQQIGMSGLQRVCNYCAYSLPSASHTASATQPDETQPTLKKQMANTSISPATPLDCSSGDPKECKAISDRGTTVCETKQPFRRRESAMTHTNQSGVGQAIPVNVSSRSTIFPMLHNSFSPNVPCPIPTFPNLLSSVAGTKLSRVPSARLGVPSNQKLSITSSQQGCPCCRQQLSDSFAVSSNRSVDDYSPFSSNFDGHVYGNLNETHISELWSRMVGSYVRFRCNVNCHMPNSNRLLDVDTLELAGLSSNPKELQVIKFTHQQRTVYCASGLSLVYWLTSNISEVQQCRNKARSVCQRFLDLSLLAPLKDTVSNEFRDDFTPYELKQVTPTVYVPSVPKTGRRLSWPMDSTCKPTNVPKFSHLGADEPDWLQEIDNLSFSHLHSSGLNASSVHLRGETTYSSTRGCSNNCELSVRHTGRALSKLSTSVDLGLKAVLPQDSSLQHDFEVGEDVRANKDTFCVNTLGTDRRSCMRESAPELSNTTFIHSRLSPTTDVATKPLASSVSQNLELIHTFKSSFDAHVRQLALQEIRDNHLDVGWTDILAELAHNVCDQVKFDLRATGLRPLGEAHAVPDSSATNASSSTHSKRHAYSPMDIRHYVHIKKLLDNSGLSSEIFPGVVFSKRATHKFMPNLLRNPRILLLASSIEYQRTPTKLTCLESQIMQEEEYLSNCVSKLLRLHPNVIFVGGSVSYVAQMLLLKTGLILFCNVKRSVLIRIARATGADILESCDRLVSETSCKSASVQRSSAQLGTSRQFKVEQVHMSDESSKFLTFIQNSNKTLAVVSSASSDQPAACKHITCEVTVLLRGPDLAMLKRVKRALGFMLHVCHNVKLERSYMTNGFFYRTLPPVTTTPLTSRVAVAHCRPQVSCLSSVPSAATLPDNESCSSGGTSDLQQPPKELTHVDGSALVNYLQHRLFNPSASVQIALPFLATADGQQAPLVAYYTYVIEWPFGRVLNDVLKRKLKVIHSELYALEHAKRQRLNCPIATLDHKCLEHRSRRHAFLTYNIQSNCPDVPQTPVVSKQSSPVVQSALDKCISIDALSMIDSVTVSCEAIYTDFKARGPEKELPNHSATRPALSRLSYGLINLMAAHSDLLLDIRTHHLSSPQHYQLQHPKSTSNKVAVTRKLATSSENNQKIKRLERSILDPRSHQFFNFLATLFSVKSPMWPEPCVPPWIASVEFYGSQDLPLGLFLERCCFTHQPCRHPHCDWPMSDHVQRFVQSSGSVQLFIRKLPQDPPRPAVTHPLDGTPPDNSGRRDSRIIMWLYCSICRTNSPAAYLSGDTWHYSFVKFLDLLINTPADWARCAMRTPTTSIPTVTEISTPQHLVGVSDQVNKHTDFANSVRHIDINSSTATKSGTTLPGWQLTCTHSAHKSVQHCFSLDRKVAVFKYQHTKVFEVVMPANEIRIYPSPSLAAKCRLFSTERNYDQSLLVTDAALASDSMGAAQPTANQRAVAIPSYLHADAVETWEKYYRSYTSVKAHLVTLQQDNVNPELDSLLKTYVYLLENDSRRKFWEVRAELLAYLINLDNRCSTALSSKRNFSGVQLLNSTPSIPHSFPAAVSDVRLETKASVSNVDSFKLSRGDMDITINRTDDLAFGVSPPLGCVSTDEPVIMVQPPVLRFHTPIASSEVKSLKDPASSLIESDGNGVEYTGSWATFLETVDVVEKTFMVQNLVNDLKRWIYGFVSEWNNRCAEYESQVKRLEKNAKETRKKNNTNVNSHGLLSSSTLPQSWRSKSPNPDPSTFGILTQDSSCLASAHTASKVALISGHCNPLSTSFDYEMSGLPHSSSAVFPQDKTGSGKFPEVAVNSIGLGSIHRAPSALDNEANQSICIGNQRLRVHQPVLTVSEVTDDADLQGAVLHPHPSHLSSSSDESLSTKTQTRRAETERRSQSALPILDPINLKAVYDTLEPPSSTVSLAPPTHQRTPSGSLIVDSAVQAAASAATIPLTAPSGMRRFIHTLMPSSNDCKVFDDPFPANEHPQLSLIDDDGANVFKHSRYLSLASPPTEWSREHPRSTEYMYNLVQHLRMMNPDVYVNDRELTSIIAYALSTPEYERHLVDLYSEPPYRNADNPSFQIGQSALSELCYSPRDNSSQASPVTSLRTTHGSRLRSDREPNVIDVSRASTLSARSGDQSLSETTYPKNVPLESDSITVNGSTKLTGFPHISVTAQGTGAPNSGIGDKTGTVGSRHIKIQFSDSTTNFYCCVYYAAEFFRLRQLLLPQGDTGFIRSLSRSFQWDALGGKSGSLFMKTRDERFVVKELSTIEMKTFHEISQQYFDYLISAALEQRLCVLSRILGIFHVGFKNSLSGEAHRFDVLVMENLFHDRTQLAFIYDLKGSLRKRLVDESSAFKTSSKSSGAELPVAGQTSENRHTVVARGGSNVVECNHLDSDGNKRAPVLLDQNLLNASVDSPLYLRVHSKNALSHCLQVDTDFLANLFLMDYSLLVGVDLSTNQLVIGLIDYLRKFTFDKRMEMMIKQTITSVQGPPPTILTPDLYRERFLVQMDNYFPLVPDQWYDSLAEHAEAWLVRASATPIASAAQPVFQGQVNSAKNIQH